MDLNPTQTSAKAPRPHIGEKDLGSSISTSVVPLRDTRFRDYERTTSPGSPSFSKNSQSKLHLLNPAEQKKRFVISRKSDLLVFLPNL